MKKWNFSNKYIGWGVTAFLVILSGLVSYYLLFHGSKLISNIKNIANILMPVVFGLVIAYLLTPILNYLEHKWFIPLCKKLHIKESKRRNDIMRALAILVTIMLTIALIALLVFMISEIITSIFTITSNFETYVNNIYNWVNKMLEDNPTMRDNAVKLVKTYSAELTDWFNTTVLSKSSKLLKTVSLGVLGSIKVLWNLIIGIIISIYVMANKEKFAGQFKKIIFACFQNNTANIILNNFKFAHNTFSGFISGKILDSILIGILCFIGTYMMHSPYAALISVIIGVTNVIPFFGPYLGAIPSGILIFIVDPMHPLNVVYFALFILVLQQFDGNVLGPKILGNSTGLTSFWVIFAITFFGGLWNVIGMLIGVPLFAVIYAAIRSIINTKLYKKNLPLASEDYTYICAVDQNGMHEYIPDHKLPKKEQKQYRFGQNFLCNYEEQIDGEYLLSKDKEILSDKKSGDSSKTSKDRTESEAAKESGKTENNSPSKEKKI